MTAICRPSHRPLWVADSTGRCNTLDAIAAKGVLHMKRRPRIYYSARQRSLMWEHWRKGETLHQIARLFDRYHSSVHRILAESGGIRPAERHRSRSALTLIEREEISRGIVEGRSTLSRRRSAARRLRSVARFDATMARKAIEPARPTKRRGIEAVARRSVNWCRTESWPNSWQANSA